MENKGAENLIPFNELTEDEQREIRRKGGIISGQVRREKKLMKEVAEMLLSMPIKKGDLNELTDLASAKGKNITVQESILLAQIQKAIKGDTAAAAYIRDTAGQKPKDDIHVTQETYNPYDELTVEELRKLAKVDDDGTDENYKSG